MDISHGKQNTRAGDIIHILCGQTMRLMPERCLCWHEEQALLLADLHLGKEATFRAAGIPLPEGPSIDTLKRLSAAVAQTGARRLLILGDLFHGNNAIASMGPIMDTWRKDHPLPIELITGSHDRWSGELPEEWQISVHPEFLHVNPFILRHYPENDSLFYTLSGHLHPGILIKDNSRADSLRLPCFQFGNKSALLPAFGTFTGLTVITRQPGDACYAIADDMVVPLQ